ncbi:N-carbamoyl-D-amino acid hydrolase [Pseudocercospora fuligena]|uniref:N-carbamoyl-D-amino acid hydrolase n=1 Tax=Pseudocercospora fuligena TaxID=685502 RepID=A0A8H6REL3_9PEZI|nr:N-carbamoyl-D-amino acid hydrolase [Pseudocercospora fuligena]
MSRRIRVAAAQIGAVHRTSARAETLQRMLKLLETAASQGAQLVLFPETAFTTFFPRYLIEDQTELDSFFEHGDIRTAPQTAPLFDKAKELDVDISVGFAEATENGETFNTCIYFHAKTGDILSKYRKVHLPGDFEPFKDPNATNQLEKRYFKPGDLGFKAFRVPELAENTEPIFGMMICNDRRWSEAWRCYGLQGVEMVLCGYNTAGFAPHLWGADLNQDPAKAEEDAIFHHKLTMQSNSYMNATFSICAARCGMDDGQYNLIGSSLIIDPEGKILAETKTKEDEVIVADCDLDACRQGKTRTFDFGRHRRIEHYTRIVEQTGVIEPPRLAETQASLPNGSTTTTNGTSNTLKLPNRPSQEKKIRILLCNPNATQSMTDSCLKMVSATLPPDVSVDGFTGPSNDAPTAIEGTFDSVLSSAACARALIPIQERESYDAILVACYSNHPLIPMLREEFEIPIIGIMEASLLAARTLGARFGIVATSQRSKVMHKDSVKYYGMEGYCAGIESCDLGVLDLERLPREEVLSVMRKVAKKLVYEDGAEVLTLGCAGMTDMKSAVEEVVAEEGVQVVDGVVAGVQHLVGIVRMGGKTSKKGLYRSSKAGRERRGQEYV